MAAPALESMDSAFTMLDSVDLKRGEIADEKGNRVELTDGLFGKFRDSRDRRVRRTPFRPWHTAFAGMGNTIAALYAGNVRRMCSVQRRAALTVVSIRRCSRITCPVRFIPA